MEERLRGMESESIAEDAFGDRGTSTCGGKRQSCVVLWISEPLVVNLHCNGLMGNFPVGLLAV